ncbi:short-chain fatty acids transporter [Corynebacterium suranareeae]|uniref:Short-chain fatty acids transporter n=1 Tax=Corynebacterium suranareeae TaxID=2506452 RepID=A0A160PPV4_9CORY|nr:TIGR00366 family protein [Corynebacterium suranareeae]BAU95556.1 short-chain fatty acids transporter [Corynebacterium suranareeae]
MSSTFKTAKKAAPKQSFMDRYLAWFIRWMPESFVICLALTVFVGIFALIATDTPLWSMNPETTSVVSAWAEGFWSLLAFTMQMTVLLSTGSAVASSPPAQKVLTKIASIPNSKFQAILLGSVSAVLLGYVHWGLGMMAAIVLGKEILAQSRIKGYALHPPVMIAALFMAFLPSSAGISGAAVLYAATPGYLKDMVPENYQDRVPEAVPLTDSVLRLDFIILLVICSIITTGFALLMHPKSKEKTATISDEFFAEIQAGSEKIVIPRSTPAEKSNASRWIMYLVGGIGLLYSIFSLWTGGVTGLTLNSFNFLFLSLGMVLTANYGPEYYAKLIREGIQGTWGFILQFPFYAGIFGLISFTGLGVVISGFFTSISTATTWPVIAFLYSGLLNIAVPSGGSKFVIEAPYIIPTTIDLGADMGLVLQAYQMGDGATNLLIPFFALPYLANFKIKFSQVVGYTVPPVLVVLVVTCIYLFVRASMI